MPTKHRINFESEEHFKKIFDDFTKVSHYLLGESSRTVAIVASSKIDNLLKEILSKYLISPYNSNIDLFSFLSILTYLILNLEMILNSIVPLNTDDSYPLDIEK